MKYLDEPGCCGITTRKDDLISCCEIITFPIWAPFFILGFLTSPIWLPISNWHDRKIERKFKKKIAEIKTECIILEKLIERNLRKKVFNGPASIIMHYLKTYQMYYICSHKEKPTLEDTYMFTDKRPRRGFG